VNQYFKVKEGVQWADIIRNFRREGREMKLSREKGDFTLESLYIKKSTTKESEEKP